MALLLAIEGGGTHSRFGLYDAAGLLLEDLTGGSLNLVADGAPACIQRIVRTAEGMLKLHPGNIGTIFAGLAGAGDPELARALAEGLAASLPVDRIGITTDLHPILLANLGATPGVLAIAGTGSSILAHSPDGGWMRRGGRGAHFGDCGSAYQIAMRGLQAMAAELDGIGEATTLTPRFLALRVERAWPEYLARAGKGAIASLARQVSEAAAAGDRVAQACINSEAEKLAIFTASLRGVFANVESVPLFVHGGVFRECHGFRAAFEVAVQTRLSCTVQPTRVEGHAAVAALRDHRDTCPWTLWWERPADGVLPALSATEEARAGQRPLDALSAAEIVETMQAADEECLRAAATVHEEIARAIDLVSDAFAQGGRLIYIGAGTSGRLGVLDASECPPTFGVAPEQVTGIIAGGEGALTRSIEGAEDDREQGRADIEACGVRAVDVVVGIAASGNTPYVRAALDRAREAGAATILLSCNPQAAFDGTLCIAVPTGAEVLPGSTRLKAGTATKLVLNRISTGALARSGFVYHGRMVGVRPVNDKLGKRAVRIVAELTGLSFEDGAVLLAAAGQDIRVAVLMHQKAWPRDRAERVLRELHGHLKRALDRD
ncbi:MAG: N-acetylmuramic acid 6-phosphate etherase [Candidatus Hydrogenedentes bacterium]|nr:N-acetylmuramic acid 6-phosphate etherase [Candidatus Hydrogenedentota bacterium]